MTTGLDQLLATAARRWPEHIAAEDPARETHVTYRVLNVLSDEVRDALVQHGVVPGDRIGICAAKSVGTLISVLGVLKAGAAYVPVDATAPARRNAYIFDDCSVRAIIAQKDTIDGLRVASGLTRLPLLRELTALNAYGEALHLVEGPKPEAPCSPVSCVGPPEELAYILYTSGSTGTPKGVMHTHESALSFIEWCSDTFQPTEQDRFSSHAPFHFDLSILDIFVPLRHGATLVLIGEDLGKLPVRLAQVISERRISVWYSTPSILRLLAEYGRTEALDYSALRLVLFAGEVFPVKQLRSLRAIWPKPRFYNLYGPTETNVCTYFEVPREIPELRTEPFPIGKTCSNDRTKVMDEHQREVAPGEEGELYVSGGTVMRGYCNLPDRTDRAFYKDEAGTLWYRTGDIVRDDGDGNYDFLGRRDRMVKRSGYRVELGEIEAALYLHGDAVEVAVIAVPDEEKGVLIHAFLGWSGTQAPSLIELKRFCAENLPLYMIPDRFSFPNSLPKTSTNKIDYQALRQLDEGLAKRGAC